MNIVILHFCRCQSQLAAGAAADDDDDDDDDDKVAEKVATHAVRAYC